MKPILKDKSFQLSTILKTLFIGTGIAFLFLGIVDYSWVLFGLLPIVLGVAIGTMSVRKYALWGTVITTLFCDELKAHFVVFQLPVPILRL